MLCTPFGLFLYTDSNIHPTCVIGTLDMQEIQDWIPSCPLENNWKLAFLAFSHTVL